MQQYNFGRSWKQREPIQTMNAPGMKQSKRLSGVRKHQAKFKMPKRRT